MGHRRSSRGPYGPYRATKRALMYRRRVCRGSYVFYNALNGPVCALQSPQGALICLIRPSRGFYGPYKDLKGLLWLL
jgi:hypothetical protein